MHLSKMMDVPSTIVNKLNPFTHWHVIASDLNSQIEWSLQLRCQGAKLVNIGSEN